MNILRDIRVDFADMTSEGSNVLIGTPGRLLDVLMRSKTVCASTLEVLVLDEADRLLDLGFETTLLSIIGRLPKQRRTGLFSATQAVGIKKLLNRVSVEIFTNFVFQPMSWTMVASSVFILFLVYHSICITMQLFICLTSSKIHSRE